VEIMPQSKDWHLGCHDGCVPGGGGCRNAIEQPLLTPGIGQSKEDEVPLLVVTIGNVPGAHVTS
jgi:hypothetical protein